MKVRARSCWGTSDAPRGQGIMVYENGEQAVPQLITARVTRGDYPAQVYCIDCETAYIVCEYRITCNGQVILQCPWCRPDSAPWIHARGE